MSDPANLKQAKRHREVSAALARGEGKPNERAARAKTIVLFASSLHSTEIVSSQTAAEMIHRLVSGREEGEWLKWYREYLGTEFEGGPMPRRSREGAPQVVVNLRRMGPTGARYVIAPPRKDSPNPFRWSELPDRDAGAGRAERDRHAPATEPDAPVGGGGICATSSITS